jgi:hypothetical protein
VIGKDSDKRAQTARESILAGRSGEAKVFLESIRAHESHNPILIFLHAYASVSAGDLGASLSSLERLKQRFPAYVPGRELAAFMRFKSAPERNQSIAPYLELSTEGVHSRHIKKLIKNIRSVYDFQSFQKSLNLADALPLDEINFEDTIRDNSRNVSVSKHGKRKLIRIPFGIIALGLIAFSLIAVLLHVFINTDIVSSIFSKSSRDLSPVDRADISRERYPVVDIKIKNAPYLYKDESALKNDYEKARQLIKDGQGEDALLIINYIKNSNAQLAVRDRAAFLASYVAGMDNRIAKRTEISALTEKPLLWQGILVTIRGSVVSLEKKGGGTRMVLFGKRSDDRPNPVNLFYNGDLNFKNDEIIEVTGLFTQIIGKDMSPYIEIKSALRVEK